MLLLAALECALVMTWLFLVCVVHRSRRLISA